MTAPSNRLLSLDFLRGLIMVLLALEAAGLFRHMIHASEGSWLYGLFIQFEHHPWNGLRFWDLVQPGFMFMAGVAMAYSIDRQVREGYSWRQSFFKALRRSGWLFFWGVLDYAVRPHGLSFELWDVLTQLSFTTLVAFLIFRWNTAWQITFSVGLLSLTEILYRFVSVPGFDQPFTDQHNFGNYVDLLLMSKINPDGWVAINAIPTACHTVWGALAGKLLLSAADGRRKIGQLVLAGLLTLVIGYGLDAFEITPIIKRIATSSFTLASGGYCLIFLAAAYGWVDVMNHRKGLTLFTVVGMNSLFIYLFFEIVGHRWFNGYVGAVANGLMGMAGIPESLMWVITSLVIFGLEWGMCYYLYRRKIFFRV